jgi:YegS C-terminal NAD kinase beta sandwich-like domain
MTVERGQDWGRRINRPDELVEVAGDAAAGALVTERRRAGRPLPPLGLRAGDLRRTLGRADPVAVLDREVSEFTVDLGVVTVAGEDHWFVSHAVARRSWWRGEVVAAMNAEFVGPWDVSPRGHPNDGRLDLVRVRDLSVGDRWKAWRRLPSGTHLPHPGIEVRAVTDLVLELAEPLTVHVDGVVAGTADHLVLRVEPDALTVCV